MAEPIRLDEWLAELNRVTEAAPPDGFSVADLAEASNTSIKTAREMIGLWSARGLVRCVGKRAGETIDGRRKWTPVYAKA